MIHTKIETEFVKSERNKEHDFRKDMETKGDYAEYLIKRYLSRFSNIESIEDKSNEYLYQKADIDLLAKFENKPIRSLEIKGDHTLFPNFFFETVSRKNNEDEDDVPGCLFVSDADILFYLYTAIDAMLVISISDLLEWLEERLTDGKKYRKSKVYNKTYHGEGYLIPIREMMGETPRVPGVPKILIKDINTGEVLDFNAFEKRRISMKKTVGKNYVKAIVKEKNWEEKNKALFKNKGKLQIKLRDVDERYDEAIETMYRFRNLREKKESIA